MIVATPFNGSTGRGHEKDSTVLLLHKTARPREAEGDRERKKEKRGIGRETEREREIGRESVRERRRERER